MTPNLHKTLKVSAETHHLIKLFASCEGVSMAALLDSWVDEHKSFKSILTPEERRAVSQIFSPSLDHRLSTNGCIRLYQGLIDELTNGCPSCGDTMIPAPHQPTYQAIHTPFDFTVWPEPNQTAYLPCKNKAHDTTSIPMNGTEWAVATHDADTNKVDHVHYITMFTGTCPVCSTLYAYSPDATPPEFDTVKKELENPDPRPGYLFPSQKNVIQQGRGY